MHATRTITRKTGLCLAAAAVAVAASACASSPGTSDTAVTTGTDPPVIDPGDGGAYAPVIDPSAFVDQIDNPYFPLLPGTKWEYESVGAEQPEHTTVVVTNFRRRVMGVSTVVVTRDWNPLEPDVVEEKSYAPGIGLVSEDTVAGRHGAAELVSLTPGRTT